MIHILPKADRGIDLLLRDISSGYELRWLANAMMMLFTFYICALGSGMIVPFWRGISHPFVDDD